ncbi:MAG: AAA family ATPase [Thermoleophilia bacterium]|nr:AAA family ATPase [Thermoleophilia bacterium]
MSSSEQGVSEALPPQNDPTDVFGIQRLKEQAAADRSISATPTPRELLGKLEIDKPDVSFDDIGGQQGAKREIQGLAFALKNPDLYRKWGTKPPKGVILYGPPGTGKTLMAKALAAQADARFFHVEASDIASKYYGESERIVKRIFDLAGKGGETTIIFIDELDAVAPRRDGAHEATQRIVATILENMDGMGASESAIVVASTNRLETVEPALLRSGRFDRWVEVGLPDEEGRKQILRIHMRKAVEKSGGRELFKNDLCLDTIVGRTSGASGADIAEIIRRTLEEKVRQEGTTEQDPGSVCTADIVIQLEEYEKTKQARNVIDLQRSEDMLRCL